MSTLHAVFFAAAFIISAFFFWRLLRSDYESEKIFTLSLVTLITGIILTAVFVLSVGKFPQVLFYVNTTLFWFWPASLAFFFSNLFARYKFSMKPFEIFEAQALAFIYFQLLTTLFFRFFFAATFFALFLVLFHILKFNYKKFTWYRSGRIGFAGLVTLATFFLARSIIAIFLGSVLSLSGRADTLVSAIVAFILFLNLYKLTYN